MTGGGGGWERWLFSRWKSSFQSLSLRNQGQFSPSLTDTLQSTKNREKPPAHLPPKREIRSPPPINLKIHIKLQKVHTTRMLLINRCQKSCGMEDISLLS